MDSNLVEIFSSVQGEGPSVGESTLFIRFAGCDLRCSWCDSPHTWKPSQSCRIEKQRGSGDFLQVENPVPMNLVLDAAKNLSASSHRWISLTGGEPLLQKSLPEMASALKVLGTKVQLETIWQSDTVLTNHYATSVHNDGVLYGFHGRQEYSPSFRAVDLEKGKVLWNEERFGGGSVISSGGYLLILRED